LTPLLALLLVHDHLLSKRGIAAPATHPLRQAVERHKARLKGEFTKARVRRGCASLDDLQAAILREKNVARPGSISEAMYPRWVRINNVKTTFDSQLHSTFSSYQRVHNLGQLTAGQRQLYIDANVPDLVAVPPGVDFSSSPAYKEGEIILQDKASCFPAYLLLGDEGVQWEGNLMDGCAAPGNKTTHLASLLSSGPPKQKRKRLSDSESVIFSMDVSPTRSKTLQKMVSMAGADKIVTVLSGQDFLALDPADSRFERVTGLLLDPSCSGSGIIGRDDVPQLALPAMSSKRAETRGKKRKRRNDDKEQDTEPGPPDAAAEPGPALAERLSKLANLQTHIVEHALSFPAAKRVTYSTCSIHVLENEFVVSRVLASEVAKRGGWRIMRRDEQPKGLRKWKHRGIRTDAIKPGGEQTDVAAASVDLSDEELDACLRCWPGDDEGTSGFFVAGFVRDESTVPEMEPLRTDASRSEPATGSDLNKEDADEEEWAGFSD
jgi:putative methyltransferase